MTSPSKNILIIANLKTDYQTWKKRFDEDKLERSKTCNENKTLVCKIGPKKVMLAMFDINEKGIERRKDSKFQRELVEPFCEQLEIYSIEKLEKYKFN